eukprot:jgi/Chrzof1/6081/Cz17g09010.t1
MSVGELTGYACAQQLRYSPRIDAELTVGGLWGWKDMSAVSPIRGRGRWSTSKETANQMKVTKSRQTPSVYFIPVGTPVRQRQFHIAPTRYAHLDHSVPSVVFLVTRMSTIGVPAPANEPLDSKPLRHGAYDSSLANENIRDTESQPATTYEQQIQAAIEIALGRISASLASGDADAAAADAHNLSTLSTFSALPLQTSCLYDLLVSWYRNKKISFTVFKQVRAQVLDRDVEEPDQEYAASHHPAQDGQVSSRKSDMANPKP